LENTSQLGADSLRDAYEATGDESLACALRWTDAVNSSVQAMVHNILPVPGVAETLKEMQAQADIVVVSAADHETLNREWGQHGLLDSVSEVAGQEVGSKAESLLLARATH
jgi:phosphoglycolate phosphatase-like HAD superfamily hydrolase